MAKQIIIRRTFPDRKGGTYEVDYEAPEGMSADDAMKLSDAAVDKLEQYTGDPGKLSPTCGLTDTTPTPPTDPVDPADPEPYWNPAVAPGPMEKGAPYYVELGADAIVDMPTGVTILFFRKTGGSLSYLITAENKVPSYISGTPPTDAVAGTVVISAFLSNGAILPKEFSIGVKATVDIYGLAQLGTGNIIWRVGGDSTNDTIITITSFPQGFVGNVDYAMGRSTDKYDILDGKSTYFYHTSNTTTAGRYVARFKRGVQIAYAAVDFDPNKAGQAIVLSFSADIPAAAVSLGDMRATVNNDRTVSLSVVASGTVEMTSPRLTSASANTSFSDMSADGSTFRRTTQALAPGDYVVDTYRIKGTSTSKSNFRFTVATAKIVQVDFAYLAPSADYSLGRWEIWVKTNRSGGYLAIETSEISVGTNPIVDPNFNFYYRNDQIKKGDETFTLRLKSASNGNTEDTVVIPLALGTVNVTRKTVYPLSAQPDALPSVDYGIILGNSLLKSGPIQGTLWQATRGMAATADNKDYYSLMRAGLRGVNSNCQLFAANQGAGMERIYQNNNDDVTNNINNILSDMTAQFGSAAKLKFVYVSLGENVDDGNFNGTKMRSMLDRFLGALPLSTNPILLFRNSVWGGHENFNSFIQSYASEKGALFVDMSPLRENPAYMNTNVWQNAGIDHHLNDAGMQRLADDSLAALRSSAKPPSGGAVPTLAGGWAEGTLQQLYALAPFVPTNNQLSSWAPNTEQVIDNEYIAVGIRNSVGASVTRLVDKRWGFNMINTNSHPGPRGQYGTEDTGRSQRYSAYAHPNGGDAPPIGHPYKQNGKTTDIRVSGDDTGYNPVPGGSRFLDRSPILWYEKQTIAGRDVLYSRVQPYHWSLTGELSQSCLHAWDWVEGRLHKWVYIWENFRSDDQMINEGRQQEGPFSYAIGNLYRQFVSFATNGIDATEITVPPPYNKNQADTGNKLTSGSWIGAYDNQDRGYALISPYCSLMGGKQFVSPSGDEFSNESGYICVRQTLDFDTPTNFMVSGYSFVGTRSELADYLRDNPVQHRQFKFNFDGGLFQGWYTIDGPLKRVNGEVVFGIGDGKGYNRSERGAAKLLSPFGHYPASQIPTLYINAAISGNTQLLIGFQKVNQAEGDVPANGQLKTVSVTGDGQYRTYAIDMANVSNYNGIICQYFIQNPIGYSPQGYETMKLGWISYQNQKP